MTSLESKHRTRKANSLLSFYTLKDMDLTTTSTRLRSASIESTASLWERLPTVKQEYRPEDNHDSTDEDSDIDELPDESNDNINSSPINQRLSASSIALNQTDQIKPWKHIIKQQQHLIIILNTEDNKQEILRHFSKQRFRWELSKEEIHPWHFGLTAVKIYFDRSYHLNIRQLLFSPSFWLTFKNEHIFSSNKPIQCSYTSNVSISLRFGALISLNQFRYSDPHTWDNRRNNRWSLCLLNSHLEWTRENFPLQQKKQILLININHAIVFDILNDGFEMYICQKCNMNEYKTVIKSTDQHRQKKPRQRIVFKNSRSQSQSRNPVPLRTHFQPRYFSRIGTKGGCDFSTVQFSLRVNSSNTTSFDKIQQTFSLLVDFFHSHKITVCYGKINSQMGPDINSLIIPRFPTHITRYSWQILSSVGYRLQLQMHLNDEFRRKLLKMSEEKCNGDELFYRVCVYLSRLFSIKPFVDINDELDHAETESRKKRDQSSYGLVRKLQTGTMNEVYIPSVTLTPTMIKIKPLKLCRTNRVLRASNQFGDPLYHFILVDICDENDQPLKPYHFRDLRDLLLNYLNEGFTIMDTKRQYRYLHHSQSQLRARQFWFYYHDEHIPYRSFPQAYIWMGDFQHERNPAKYAARMALCFSTTKATVQVLSRNVLIVPDITTDDERLSFTDGCGTISTKLRKKIQVRLQTENDFSAVQFRYDGAKGVVSVDPRMRRDKDLVLRQSMKKFSSIHDWFEVCKVSAPRLLYLNRQAIVLLSYRKISDASFLILQQQNYLSLVRALLRNSDAEKLIIETIPHWLLPRDISLAQIDFIHEPFFRQILISSCLNVTQGLHRRTRIRIPPNEGRNMIGIIDEYNVLEEGQVFIQYTELNTGSKLTTKVLDNHQVVITKNPCHHPGDIRTFTAITHPLLVHLKDVVVFSQHGQRPAPHEISGSDLDGDEYFVIWHNDLVPSKSPNAPSFNYDSSIQSKDLDRRVTRDDITNAVLDIAENDYLGRLSNLHLAFAVRSIDSEESIKLASAISEEVDSGKTGYHPLNNVEIRRYNNILGAERPDFMENYSFKQKESDHILGKLYRASCQILPGWDHLLQYHHHLRYLRIRIGDQSEETKEDGILSNEELMNQTYSVNIDPTRPEYKECIQFAQDLAYVYTQEMLEILNLYELSHENDLWCRNSNKRRSGELEDSAYSELEQLVQRTRHRFFIEQIKYCKQGQCHINMAYKDLCRDCETRQRCLAFACYDEKYTAVQAPIFSLPWLFAAPLLRVRGNQTITTSDGRLSMGMDKALQYLLFKKRRLVLKSTNLIFQTSNNLFVRQVAVDVTVCAFLEILASYLQPSNHSYWSLVISQFIQKISSVSLMLSQPDSLEIISELHDIHENDLYAAELLSIKWKEKDEVMHDYFGNILEICFNEGRKENQESILEFSENIILLLQKVVINKPIL